MLGTGAVTLFGLLAWVSTWIPSRRALYGHMFPGLYRGWTHLRSGSWLPKRYIIGAVMVTCGGGAAVAVLALGGLDWMTSQFPPGSHPYRVPGGRASIVEVGVCGVVVLSIVWLATYLWRHSRNFHREGQGQALRAAADVPRLE
jgi:hypothetical protein